MIIKKKQYYLAFPKIKTKIIWRTGQGLKGIGEIWWLFGRATDFWDRDPGFESGFSHNDPGALQDYRVKLWNLTVTWGKTICLKKECWPWSPWIHSCPLGCRWRTCAAWTWSWTRCPSAWDRRAGACTSYPSPATGGESSIASTSVSAVPVDNKKMVAGFNSILLTTSNTLLEIRDRPIEEG